jgi:DNA-directed RNA polymerase specialized sigma24 family protein
MARQPAMDLSAQPRLHERLETALTAEDEAVANERKGTLAELLEELREKEPDRYAVLIAYDLDEQTMSEIAAVLGIRTATAWNHLRRAHEDVRAISRKQAAQQRI